MNDYVKKLDEKIKELNSTRVFKKVTPKGDLSWYVKWVASFLILIAVVFRSIGVHELDMWFSILGTLGWFWVGMLWQRLKLSAHSNSSKQPTAVYKTAVRRCVTFGSPLLKMETLGV